MKIKFVASYICIAVAGALITGLLFFFVQQYENEKSIDNQLKTIANMININIDISDKNITSEIKKYSQITGLRISVINIDGEVIADSSDSYFNHSDRPEFISAVQDGFGTSKRMSESTSLIYKYYAQKVQKNGMYFIIRIAKEMFTTDQIHARTKLITVIITIAVLLVIGSYLIIRNISNINKLEQLRSEFASNVTHELKTPLTSIRGFVDTLKDGAIYDTKVAERFLDIISIEADRLSALITDTLELSEIQTLKNDSGISDYMLKDVVDEVSNIITPSAKKKNIKYKTYISPTISVVRVNFDRLKQLLLNVLDNAVKYTNSGGIVSLECNLEGNSIIFTIKDNGIGIPEDELPRLFERFYRVDKGRTRTQGGTGLGLSIVKHIVKLYKGDIDIKSSLGQGSTFTIRLPIAIL